MLGNMFRSTEIPARMRISRKPSDRRLLRKNGRQEKAGIEFGEKEFRKRKSPPNLGGESFLFYFSISSYHSSGTDRDCSRRGFRKSPHSSPGAGVPSRSR